MKSLLYVIFCLLPSRSYQALYLCVENACCGYIQSS